MKLTNFLYLTQLEEYEIDRIHHWLHQNPNQEVIPIKKQLIWTTKIKLLYIFAKVLFFLSPEKSVIFGLYLLTPFDTFIKLVFVSLAFVKLRLLHPRLTTIAITGSWGKTTVKSSLTHLIKSKHHTFSTLGNHNTLLGVTADILKMPLSTQYFIAEAGAYYPGDIAAITRLLRPSIGIITAVGPMHLERFGSLENILKTKMELPLNVKKSGTVFLPLSIKQKIFQFSIPAKNIIYFDKVDEIYSYLSKTLNLSNYTEILSTMPPVEHRLEVSHNGSITILDDTYNSNPAGFEKALKLLKSQKSKNNILVTPGMIELGDLQFSENARLAQMAGDFCQHIIIIGQTNKEALLSGLKKTKAKIHLVNSVSETEKLLPNITSDGAAILFENDLPDHYF